MRMPRSALQIALAQDDEAAEQHLAVDDEAPSPGSPPLESWSPEVEYLATVVDRLGEVIQTVIATTPGAKKPPRIRPVPRPETALDRARRRRAWARHHELVAEVEAAQARYEAKRG